MIINDKLEMYADLLLRKGVNIKKNQPLLISAPIESYIFIRVLTKKAYELGVTDIEYDFNDDVIKHDALKYLNMEDLKKTKIFNKKIFDEYAKKDAAFLMLVSEDPNLMDDIEPDKLSETAIFSRQSKPIYK